MKLLNGKQQKTIQHEAIDVQSSSDDGLSFFSQYNFSHCHWKKYRMVVELLLILFLLCIINIDCQMVVANSVLNNQIPNSPHFITKSILTQNESVYCDRAVNCSNHGDCDEFGKCICSSNYQDGYWNGPNCNTCQNAFFGNLCNINIGGPALISPDFKGVTFKLGSSISDSIPCSKLIYSKDLLKFGSLQSNVKCQYSDRSNDIFMISFGSEDFNFTPGTSAIQINSNVLSNFTAKYVALLISLPEKVEFVKAVIDMSKVNLYSSCGSVDVDGSRSYSLDRRALSFFWYLFDSNMKILSDNFPNLPSITLESTITSGSYHVGLIVKSNFLKLNSSLTVSPTFIKATSPLPMLSIFKGETTIERYTHQVPIHLKKIVSDSSCKSSTDSLHIEWSQLTGPSINYTIDSFNNLLIPKFKVFGNYNYTFRVSAFYKTSTRVYLDVNLITKSPELQLTISQVESTNERTLFHIDYIDPEAIFNSELTEIWKWTSSNASPKLLTTLQSLSNSKSCDFSLSSDFLESKEINSIDLTLKITKSDGRSAQKSSTVFFTNVPPLVNIVNIEPTSTIVLPGQLVTLQTLTNSNSTNSTWSLNGNMIDSSSIVKQLNSGMETNTISIDTSSLIEGSVNTLSIITIDTRTGLSTFNNYSFQVATTPKVCSCSVSPKEGIGMITDFLFYCTNCKTTDNNIDYRYGFIDGHSNSKIVMHNLGEIYSAKLPSPYKGNTVTCFFDIIDKTTGAFSTTNYNITINKPSLSKFEDLQPLVQLWEDQSIQFTLDGDFSKSIYQSAATSRVDSVLLKEAMEYGTKRKLSLVCFNGIEVSGECKCKDGWLGKYCDISVVDFTNIQATKISILRDAMFVMNNTELMSDEYVSLLAFTLDSILVNYQYLESNTISESLITLNSLLDRAISNQSVRILDGVDNLLSNCIEFSYKYIKEHQYVTDQIPNSDLLHIILKKAFSLQARTSPIGNSARNKKGPFYSILLSRNTIYDLPKEVWDPISNTKVLFSSNLFSYTSNLLVKSPFVSILSISEDVFSLKKRLEFTEKSASQSTYSKLVSPIVSFDFLDLPVQVNGSTISFVIPYNSTELKITTPSTSLEYIEKIKTLSCRDFRNGSPLVLRNDCTLHSQNQTHVICQCAYFTNVFVQEISIVNYHSYVYIIAIIVPIIVFGLLLLIVVSIPILIFIIRNRTKKPNTSDTTTNPSNFSLKIQEVEIETFEAKTPSPRSLYSPPASPIGKPNLSQIQSIYHSSRKRSQVIPLRMDLVDEKYCDNLSSTGSDCE